MTASLDEVEKVAEPIEQLRKRVHFLTRIVVALTVLALALGVWAIWQAATNDDTASPDRYEKARANQEVLMAIIADPAPYGTETEVLDLLDSMAIPDVVSGDLAFGGTATGVWRTGWRNTLYGSDDRSLETWRYWLSDDGSVGGSLWTWNGIADNGESFSIPGVEISRFNEEGLYEELVMFYPFEDEEVRRRVREGN